MRSDPTAGHVHVIAGDLTPPCVRRVLIPTDDDFRISASIAPTLGVEADARLRGLSWNGSRVLRHPGEETTARRWLANVGAFGEEASRYGAVIEPFVAGASAEFRAAS